MVFVLLLSLCVFASIHWMFSADYRSFGWLLLPFRVVFFRYNLLLQLHCILPFLSNILQSRFLLFSCTRTHQHTFTRRAFFYMFALNPSNRFDSCRVYYSNWNVAVCLKVVCVLCVCVFFFLSPVLGCRWSRYADWILFWIYRTCSLNLYSFSFSLYFSHQ